MKSNPTLLRWYKSINKRFFDGGCPERVCVRWADVNEEGEKHGKRTILAGREKLIPRTMIMKL